MNETLLTNSNDMGAHELFILLVIQLLGIAGFIYKLSQKDKVIKQLKVDKAVLQSDHDAACIELTDTLEKYKQAVEQIGRQDVQINGYRFKISQLESELEHKQSEIARQGAILSNRRIQRFLKHKAA